MRTIFCLCLLMFSSCASQQRFNSLEIKMKRKTLFPLEIQCVELDQMGILKVNYFNGKPVDTIACTYNTNFLKSLQEDKDSIVMNRVYDEVYLDNFIKGLTLFKKYKIYKYRKGIEHNSIPENGFKYQIQYGKIFSEYYFRNDDIPKKINKLDALLIEKGVLEPVSNLTQQLPRQK